MILAFAGCQQSHKQDDAPIDYDKEYAAILAVIDGESAAFWNKDYEKWASYWVHEPYIRTMGWWPDDGVTVVEGREQRDERSKKNSTRISCR